MADRGGYSTDGIRLPSSLPRWVSALWPVVAAAIAVYVTLQIQSYRLERVERDVDIVQATVDRTLPEIQKELAEIKAELRWMGRSLGVPAKQ